PKPIYTLSVLTLPSKITIMKMTKKIFTRLLICSIIFFCGCQGEFLDRQPIDKLTNEKFWTSKKDAELALAGCYSALRTPAFFIDGSSFSSMQFEGLTDNAYCNSTLDNYTNISRGILNRSTGGIQSRVWSDAYKGIARCNWFLGNLSRVPDLTESEYAIMEAEALFLRSFFYNELIMLYGDVPLITEQLGFGEDVFKVTKTPRPEIVDKITQDLDIAAAGLPNEQFSNGHPVRGSALALKARICLYHERWSEAAEAAKLVIDEERFRLAESYQG